MPRFTSKIVSLALLVPVALAELSCAPARIVAHKGCGKDTDCKGTRVCVQGACVEAIEPGPTQGHDSTLAPTGTTAPTPTSSLARAGAQFHGDPRHSGRYAGHLPAAAPREVLRFATQGTIFGGVAVAGGVAIFGSHDRGLYAVSLKELTIDADAGTIAPDGGFPPDGGVVAASGPLWRRDLGDLVWATPAIGPGVVYAGSDDDALYALDLADGAVKWRLPTGPCRIRKKVGPEGARCDVDGITVGPDGTIYAAADGLYAVRPDGTIKWKFAPGPTHCAGSPALADDGTVYVGCQDDTIYAVGPDGLKRWDLRTGDDIDGSPTLADDGTLYVGSDDRKLWAVTPDGKVRFSVVTGGPVRGTPALGADGTIFVGSFDAQLYAIAPTGAVRWTYHAADRIHSSPIVDADGTICFGAEDDRLYALEADGRLRWSIQLDGDVDSTPTLLDDGTLLVGSDDRALHVYR